MHRSTAAELDKTALSTAVTQRLLLLLLLLLSMLSLPTCSCVSHHVNYKITRSHGNLGSTPSHLRSPHLTGRLPGVDRHSAAVTLECRVVRCSVVQLTDRAICRSASVPRRSADWTPTILGINCSADGREESNENVNANCSARFTTSSTICPKSDDVTTLVHLVQTIQPER